MKILKTKKQKKSFQTKSYKKLKNQKKVFEKILVIFLEKVMKKLERKL
jgi:hypothetical protein